MNLVGSTIGEIILRADNVFIEHVQRPVDGVYRSGTFLLRAKFWDLTNFKWKNVFSLFSGYMETNSICYRTVDFVLKMLIWNKATWCRLQWKYCEIYTVKRWIIIATKLDWINRLYLKLSIFLCTCSSLLESHKAALFQATDAYSNFDRIKTIHSTFRLSMEGKLYVMKIISSSSFNPSEYTSSQQDNKNAVYYCHVFMTPWLIIMGFALDDWIY
jgi:hypothetical protein